MKKAERKDSLPEVAGNVRRYIKCPVVGGKLKNAGIERFAVGSKKNGRNGFAQSGSLGALWIGSIFKSVVRGAKIWLRRCRGQFRQCLRAFYVVKGVSHEESLSRFQSGIMYYDEIMALTFLFCDYKELGQDNFDKDFFIVDAYYGSLGLFAIYNKAIVIARYVKSKGMIPVIRLTRCYGSHYSNQEGEDI